MNPEQTSIGELIRVVLRSWDIVPDDISLISARGNCHWRVSRGRDVFILRRYRRGQSDSAIQYELDILKRVRSRGWPVAGAAGDTVSHSGFVFALFPLLPGCRREGETPEQRRCRGRILADLHRDLNAVTNIGQRTGWQRADEIVPGMAARGLRERAIDRTIALHLQRVPEALHASGASSFPVALIHGDFIAQNLLFHAGELSGVLDFDSVHLDLRATDVACARRSRDDEVVRGYLEIAPLTGAELGSLHNLWRATVLRYALQIIGGGAAADTDESTLLWCVKQLEKTIPFDDIAK
jgi:Ser/Thr protein kinase RdoA (MazF antagonist)